MTDDLVLMAVFFGVAVWLLSGTRGTPKREESVRELYDRRLKDQRKPFGKG